MINSCKSCIPQAGHGPCKLGLDMLPASNHTFHDIDAYGHQGSRHMPVKVGADVLCKLPLEHSQANP